jgi:hypothetical protein
MATPSTAPRHLVPGELAARIATPTAARERYLPVDEVLASLLPEAGLVRGRSVGCSGPAAWSLAFALVARAAAEGSWVAVVGAPAVGVEAAGELGVPLGRVVVVDVHGGPSVWAERVAAAADGFEVIVTNPPVGAERVVRRVRQRLQSNGVVLVAVDATTVPSMGCDLDLVTSRIAWQGVGQGAGHLIARRALVKVGGRRAPRPMERELLLPGPDGRVARVRTALVADDASDAGPVIRLERAG